jgi:tRNA-dependent cyclodipeptide synthase
MRITGYLNCTNEDIEARKFNIFIGISLGNRYFSKEHLREYMHWAVDRTKDDVLLVIADSNHAINYEVFDGYSIEKALRHALRDGDKIVAMLDELIKEFSSEKGRLFKIVRWQAVQETEYYISTKPIFLSEFQKNRAFHDYILTIVRTNLKDRISGLGADALDKLGQYILDELPVMANGIEYKGKTYDLHPYPGLTSFDELLMGFQHKTLFKELAEKIKIRNDIAIVDAYAE